MEGPLGRWPAAGSRCFYLTDKSEFLWWLLSDKLIVRFRHVGAGVTLHRHVEIILFPKRRDGGHHRRGVMGVDGFLAGPTVDEEDGLRIVQRLVILIPQVAFLSTDSIDSAAGNQFLGELAGVSVCARVAKIDCDSHIVVFFIVAAACQKQEGHKGQYK